MIKFLADVKDFNAIHAIYLEQVEAGLHWDCKETAELLRITNKRIYTSICDNKFHNGLLVRFGRKILFKKQTLIDWLENRGLLANEKT